MVLEDNETFHNLQIKYAQEKVLSFFWYIIDNACSFSKKNLLYANFFTHALLL
jgi:hypothetical protein